MNVVGYRTGVSTYNISPINASQLVDLPYRAYLHSERKIRNLLRCMPPFLPGSSRRSQNPAKAGIMGRERPHQSCEGVAHTSAWH